jgi:hypothetical protein
MPSHSELQTITKALLKVRNWEQTNLPLVQSALAYDLIVWIAHHTVSGSPLSLKHLFILLNYSEAGVRKHLRYLIRDGWISLEGVSNDKRIRVVIAKPKLLLTLKEYVDLLSDVYSN